MKSKSMKILSLFLALMTILSTFAACNSTSTPSVTQPSTEQSTLPSTNIVTTPITDLMTSPSTDTNTSIGSDNAPLDTNTTPSTETFTMPSTEAFTIPPIETVPTPSTNIITSPSIESMTSVSTDFQTESIFTESNNDDVVIDTEIATDIVIETDTTVSDSEIESDSELTTETTATPSTENNFDTSTETITNSATESDSTINSESIENTESNASSESETIAGSVPETENSATSETTAPDVEIDDSILTVFANGAYNAAFIRGDLASSFEKTIYNEIRTLFKTKTNVNPSIKTDFTGVGKDPYTGPAILIGETSYQESKDVYATLKDNQAIAKLIGNKYVIAFSSADAAAKLITTLEGYLKKKATATEIKIDDTWNATAKVTTSYSDNTNFKDSGLAQKIDIASLGLGTQYDAGQNCKTYVKTGATKTNFTTICTAIERAGATRYTGNSIGSNLFATYVTQTQIIHVMFFPNRKEVRTAVDVRGTGTNGFGLPGLAKDNTYTKTTDSEMIVCDISNADWPGGMCIIFKLADGRFFIIDAGIGGKLSDSRKWIGSSSGWIYATLSKHAKDPKNIQVAGWLITHVHSDHAGGLYDMALGYHGSTDKGKHTVMPKEVTKYIKIDTIIYNQPATTKFGRSGWMTTVINAFNVKNVVKAHPGQVFHYADLELTIYGAQDIMLEKSGDSGDLNDFSVVSKVAFNGKTALFLGDSDTIPNPRLAEIYKTELKADILQLAHHGYGDTGDNDVNSYCNPSMVIWAVSNRDLRSNYKINVNTSIAGLSGVKNYKPGTGNLIFKKDWSTYTESKDTIMNLIPKCDGTHCGNKSCSIKTSTNNSYNS